MACALQIKHRMLLWFCYSEIIRGSFPSDGKLFALYHFEGANYYLCMYISVTDTHRLTVYFLFALSLFVF